MVVRRSVRGGAGRLGVVGIALLAAGCAQVLGLEPWSDPPAPPGAGGEGGAGASSTATNGGGAEAGAGGAGGAGGASATSSTSHTSSATGAVTGPTDMTPTCFDEIHNGDEADTDCGGDACPGCPLGGDCSAGADCESNTCSMGLCVPFQPDACTPPDPEAPTCNDCTTNGGETDQDCGGEACLPCGFGEGCATDGDCFSALCAAGACQKGAAGAACKSSGDCASGVCAPGSCFYVTCCQ